MMFPFLRLLSDDGDVDEDEDEDKAALDENIQSITKEEKEELYQMIFGEKFKEFSSLF